MGFRLPGNGMLDNRALIGISRPRLLWCLADRVIFCGLIRQMAQLAPGLAPLADSPIEHCFPRWVRDGGPCLPCDSLARQKTNTGKMPTMIGWDLEGSFLAAMAGRNGSKLRRSKSRKPALNRLPVSQAPSRVRRWLLASPRDPPRWRTSSPPDGMDDGSWCG